MSEEQSKLKLAVFETLKKQPSPISLPQLLTKLGSDYTERTVRRWLAEWIETGVVQKTGQKRSTRYQATKTRSAELTTTHFSPANQKILEQVKTPYALRKPVTYNPDWLDEYQPNISSYFSSKILDHLDAVGNRANNHKPAGTYARQIYNRMLTDLSYNSSRLEGNTYSLLETKQLLIDGVDTPGKLDEEKTMILNHKEAIRFLVDKSDETTIQQATIYTLHYLLSDGLVSPQYAGKVRDHGVRIGGSTYIPLENPQSLHKHLKEICRKASQITNPFEKSLFLLAHIAYLQAFVDVNKRTSRLSANIPLIHNNFVPLSFDGVNQTDYTDAMIAIYELNNIQPLIDVYIHSYQRTAEMYDATVEAIGFDQIRVQYRQQRRTMIRHIVTEKLHGEQMKKYIQLEVAKSIPPGDQDHLIRNIHEDLEQIDKYNIAGLGASEEELEVWLRGRKSKKS